jgi:hypothetical protein
VGTSKTLPVHSVTLARARSSEIDSTDVMNWDRRTVSVFIPWSSAESTSSALVLEPSPDAVFLASRAFGFSMMSLKVKNDGNADTHDHVY